MNIVKIHGKTFSFEGEIIWKDQYGRYYHIKTQEDANALGLKEENNYIIDSNYKIGDYISLSITQENVENPAILKGKVIGVHLYANNTKYDLEIPVLNESPTRIYNIDSCFLLDKI